MIEINCNTCGKLLRIPSEYAGVIGRCNGCGEAVQVPGLPRLDGPASPPALSSSDIATPAAIPPAEPYTRDESIAIDVAVSQREMARAHKDMAAELRKATLMSRLTCGCLLVTITAPIWITGLVFFATMGFTAAVAAIATFFGIAHPVGTQPDPLPVVVMNEPEPSGPSEPVTLASTVYCEETLYHFEEQCLGIVTSTAPMSFATALQAIKQPCPVCAPDQPMTPLPLPSQAETKFETAPTPAQSPPPEPIRSVRRPIVGADEVPVSRDQQSVYSSRIDGKYHKANCSKLPESADAMTLATAQSKGRTACPTCKPPR